MPETLAPAPDELRDALAREQRLNEIARVLTSTLELEVILPNVVRLAAELVGAEAGAIGLVEPDEQSIAYPYSYNMPAEVTLPNSPRGQGVAWHVVLTGESLLLPEYSAFPEALPGWIRAGMRSCLAVPVLAGPDRLGTLGLFTLSDQRQFDEGAQHLAEAVAAQAGAAIRNARLFAEARQRTAELESVAGFSRGLRSAPTRAEMLPIILDQVLEVLAAQSAALALHDPETGDIIIQAGRGGWADAQGERVQPGQGLGGQVVASGRPIVVADAQAGPEGDWPDLVGTERAVAGVPLITRGEAQGALLVARTGRTPVPFTAGEVRLLTALGDMTASAINRATLHEQTSQRLQRLTALRHIDIAITSSLDLQVTLNVLLDHVIGDLAVDAATVLLLNPAAGTLDYAAARGFRTEALQHTHLPLGAGHAGRAANEQRVVYIPDLRAHAGDLARAPLLARESFVTYYAHPLIAKGQVRGVLEIFHRERLEADNEWREFLEALAAQAAIALDNAVLFSDLQQSLEAQRAAQAQLVRAARLTAVGELAAGVAHQINNPLTTVIADAQLLLRFVGVEHPAYSSANAIYQAGWRAQRVVRRLLNFARPEEGEFVPTDLNETIVAALDLVSAHIERSGVELVVTLGADLPSVPGSDRQLEEIWINLLLNARDAMAEGRSGRITLESRLAADGQTLEVAVADNGKGMDENARAKIFTPFFTTKEPGRGNGLGLSVCQTIAQNHGGSISFESQAGQGTTFLVRLPRVN